LLFFNQLEFEAFNAAQGNVLKGVEDFEESTVPAGVLLELPAPLNGNPNIGFPEGLAEDNITIQDNITAGPYPPNPNPSGHPRALFVVGQGFMGANSKKVGEELFFALNILASVDLIFPSEDNHTGVGFELSRAGQIVGWHIGVYDTNGALMSTFQLPPPDFPEPSKSFFGIWCTQSIGRINIADDAIAPDGIDDIQMWRPGSEAVGEAPSPAARPILEQNVPNPFNPTTEIRYTLQSVGKAGLCVYDSHGRLIRTLAQGLKGAGDHVVVWDGRRDDGEAAPSGIYYYRLSTDAGSQTRQAVLLK
jgi:hypothetical protein